MGELFRPKKRLSSIFCNHIPLNLLTWGSWHLCPRVELPGPAHQPRAGRETWKEERKWGQGVGSCPSDEVCESELAGTRHQHQVGHAIDAAGLCGSSPAPAPHASRHILEGILGSRAAAHLTEVLHCSSGSGRIRGQAGESELASVGLEAPPAPALNLSTVQRGTWLELLGPNGVP